MDIPIKLNLPDQEPVDPEGQAILNMVVASSGVRLRPALTDLADTGETVKIDGIYNWEEQNYVVAVAGGNVYKIKDSLVGVYRLLAEDGSYLMLENGHDFLALEPDLPGVEDVTNDTMGTGTRVIFGNFGDYLYMANGSTIKELHPATSQVSHGGNDYTCIKNNIAVEPGVTSGWATYWQDDGAGSSYDAWSDAIRYGSGYADALEDPDAPTSVYFILVADKYLHALDRNTETVYFSVVDEPWSFDSDFFSAEHMPDDANCMAGYNSEIYVGGRRSIEIFVNDGSTPWVPSGYGAISSGVLAPYSFARVKGSFLWIDERRKLVTLSGREAVSVNESLDTFLNDITSLADAMADVVTIDGIEYYILTLTKESRTIAVNTENMSWSEWTYEPDGYTRRLWANCMTMVPLWNCVLVGGVDGQIKKIASNAGTDDATAIGGLIRSPRMQTAETITVSRLAIGVTKVSPTDEEGTATIRVRWRDDGRDWGNYQTKTVSHLKTDDVLDVWRCGSYQRNRQYEFDLSGIWPFAVQRVEQL